MDGRWRLAIRQKWRRRSEWCGETVPGCQRDGENFLLFALSFPDSCEVIVDLIRIANIEVRPVGTYLHVYCHSIVYIY